MSARKDPSLSRHKRQTFSSFNPVLSPPVFFQYNGQIPLTASQINAARCQALFGQAPPIGCIYVPVIMDSDNLPLNCRIECPNNSEEIPFQLLPVIGQFGPPLDPEYLRNNRFSVIDNSNNDALFVGDSNFVFTPSTTTTTTTTNAPVVVTTTTTTAAPPLLPQQPQLPSLPQ